MIDQKELEELFSTLKFTRPIGYLSGEDVTQEVVVSILEAKQKGLLDKVDNYAGYAIRIGRCRRLGLLRDQQIRKAVISTEHCDINFSSIRSADRQIADAESFGVLCERIKSTLSAEHYRFFAAYLTVLSSVDGGDKPSHYYPFVAEELDMEWDGVNGKTYRQFVWLLRTIRETLRASPDIMEMVRDFGIISGESKRHKWLIGDGNAGSQVAYSENERTKRRWRAQEKK